MESRIFEMDCVTGMRSQVADDSVDVVVTSPPYNIGTSYSTHNDNMPFELYLDWIEQVAVECKRVLKGDGSFFFNMGDKPSDEFRALKTALRVSNHFCLQNTIHWVKSIAAPEEGVNVGHFKPVNSKRFLNGCHEYIFHFTPTGNTPLDKLAIGVPYQDKSNIGRWKAAQRDCRGRGNTWYIPYATVTGAKLHPAAFPVRLPEMCISLHGVTPDTVVMDPFAGVGSSLVAAQRLGCAVGIGFETDALYVKHMKEALDED